MCLTEFNTVLHTMKKHVGFRLPKFLADKLQEEADKSNRALTTVIVDILERHYDLPALDPSPVLQSDAIAKFEELSDRMKTWEFALQELHEKIADLNQQHLIARQSDLDAVDQLAKKHHELKSFSISEIKSLGEAINPLTDRIEVLEKSMDEVWHWQAEAKANTINQLLPTINAEAVKQPVEQSKEIPQVIVNRKPDSNFPGCDLVTYTYPGGKHTNREPAESPKPELGQPSDIEMAIREMKEYCGDDDDENALKPIELAARLKVSKATISKWQKFTREKQKANTNRHDPSGFSWQYSERKKLWYPYPQRQDCD